MVERREIIFSVENYGSPECSGVEDHGGKKYIYVKPAELGELAGRLPLPAQSSLVVDLSEKKLSRRERKALRRVGREVDAELIWWQDLASYRLPSTEEADALIISVPVAVSAVDSLVDWPRQIKKLLTYYPCTRLFLHFDLHCKDRDDNGTERP